MAKVNGYFKVWAKYGNSAATVHEVVFYNRKDEASVQKAFNEACQVARSLRGLGGAKTPLEHISVWNMPLLRGPWSSLPLVGDSPALDETVTS